MPLLVRMHILLRTLICSPGWLKYHFSEGGPGSGAVMCTFLPVMYQRRLTTVTLLCSVLISGSLLLGMRLLLCRVTSSTLRETLCARIHICIEMVLQEVGAPLSL